MIVRDDAQLRPTIHNGQQTQMAVRRGVLARPVRQRKPVENLVLQQQVLSLGARTEDRSPGGVDPLLQFVPAALDHQLVQLRHRLRILADLFLRGRVEDGEPGVHVPFVRVDAQRDVDLHVLDAAHPARDLPGELLVGVPGRPHAQEGGVRDRLRVGGDAVVQLAREVDILGVEAGQDVLDEPQAGVRRAVLDQDLWKERGVISHV